MSATSSTNSNYSSLVLNSLIDHYYNNHIDIEFSKKNIIIYRLSDLLTIRFNYDVYYCDCPKKIKICIYDEYTDNETIPGLYKYKFKVTTCT